MSLKLLILALLALPAFPQTKFVGPPRYPETVYASLPSAASNTGRYFTVTDCNSKACTAGSGSVWATVLSDGSTWTAASGGASGGTGSVCTPISATGATAINWNTAGPGSTACNYIQVTLTGNISLTFSNGGANLTIMWIQDGTGGRTVTLAGNMGVKLVWCTIDATASAKTLQDIVYDGTNYDGGGCPAATNGTVMSAALGGTGQSTYTKGDLLGAPGGATLNKLSVGGDGLVLTADAASTNGIKWASTTAVGGTRTIYLDLGGYNAAGIGVAYGWTWQNSATGIASTLVATVAGVPTLSNSGTPTMSKAIWLPEDYSSGLAITLFIQDASGVGGHARFIYGNVCWVSGSAPTGTMANTATSADTTFTGFANNLTIASTAIGTTGCSAGSPMIIQVRRDNTVGSNAAAPLAIITAKMTYTSAY